MSEQTNAVAVVQPGAIQREVITDANLAYIKKVYAAGVTDQDFYRFRDTANHLGLDPSLKEIYAIPGFGTDKDGNPRPGIIMPGIAGYRKLADVTGLVAGTRGPFFCGADGRWTEVWLADEPPAAAKFEVYRKDRDPDKPTVAIVTWKARARRTKFGLMGKWAETPAEMLGINAERMAWQRCGLIHNGVRDNPEGLPDRELALKRAHAAAAEHGIDHDHLRAVVQQFNPEADSLAETDAADLHAAADYIDAMGVAAVPADDASPAFSEVQARRQKFVENVRESLASGFTKKKLAEWIEAARDFPDAYQVLIECAPTEALARIVAAEAEKAGIRKETVERSVEANRDAAEVKRAQAGIDPVASPAPVEESAITSWSEFWELMKPRGVGKAEFEALVGQPIASFGSNMDRAMAAYNAAEAAIFTPDEGEGDATEGEFTDIEL